MRCNYFITHEHLKSDSSKTEQSHWRIMEVHKDCFLNGSHALFSTSVDFFKTRISPRFSPREEHKENSYITHTTQWQAKTSFASYLTPIPSFIESYKLCKNEFIFTFKSCNFLGLFSAPIGLRVCSSVQYYNSELEYEKLAAVIRVLQNT